MLDKTQPLWLPKGSGRLIMALAFTAVTCYLALSGKIDGMAFLAVQSSVMAFYYGSKSGASLPEQASDRT
jgi:hypothetical protein